MLHAWLSAKSGYPALSVQSRAILLGVLVTLEVLSISLAFDAKSLALSTTPILKLLSHSGDFLRIGIVFVVVFFLLNLSQLKTVFLPFGQLHHQKAGLWLAAHTVLLAIFAALSFLLFAHNGKAELTNAAFPTAWLVSGCATFTSLLLTFWPFSVWLSFIRIEKKNLTVALIAGSLCWLMAMLARNTWHTLADLTFTFCHALLSLGYEGITADTVTHSLGTRTFHVEISPQCSGYEGMGLISVFLSLYFWMARKQLRFPHVFLLYPIGITFIWLLNVLRISLLIVLGTEWSPEVAIGGFHSNAGWIAFVMISIGIVLLAQKLPLFNRLPLNVPAPPQTNNPAAALLLPFVLLMASILVFGAFSNNFDWLYPGKVIISLAVLGSFRKTYKKILGQPSYTAIAIGLAVFLIWIALVPTNTQQDIIFANTLMAAPATGQMAWLLFRIMGAAITVPIIEELAFRGYLINKLISHDFQKVTPGQFTPLSFGVSSLLFGALHGNWLAGTLAGMAYAGALYRRGVLADAITAHLTTNALLAAYVMLTGHWSLW
ncbi:hypothetical protein JCM14076_28310 [Methylosoma difficile]